MSFETRRERILQQGKQRQMLTSNRTPLSSEGSDGDIQIVKSREGMRILIKSGQEWFGTPPLTSLTNKENTNEIEHSFITKLKDKNNDEALSINSSDLIIHKPINMNNGAVTQGTSITTTVIINTASGIITLYATAIAANGNIEFTVTNSIVKTDSIILLTMQDENIVNNN